MLGTIVTGVVCFLGGAATMWFVAKNNKDKFVKALGMDFEQMAQALLDETEVDEKVKEFIDKVKSKFDK